MNLAEFWTWFGTILIVIFFAVIGVAAISGGDVAVATQVASVGVALAVLGASILQAISGLRRPR